MFEFSAYHLGLAVGGLGIVLACWLPRFISGREPAAAPLLLGAGVAAGLLVPGLPELVDPLARPRFWEVLSEIAVVVALFGAGLKIDRLSGDRWRPTIRLLALAMPLTIIAVALAGWLIAGLSLAAALLLAAVLSPTDPVLAGDVQVGAPMEGGEHPVRFTLTAEAGLNDGLAFPFVYLALIVAAQGWAPGEWGLEWLARDVLWKVAAGAAGGGLIGWLLGKLMFGWPPSNPLAESETGVVALAGVMLAYGATELIEGYGFIAAFVAGIALRHSESRHSFNKTLHDFTAGIEDALLALLLLALGAALPALWPALDWRLAAVGVALIFVIRPVIGWLTLGGACLKPRERAVVAFYGVRGLGTLYYLAYALSHVSFPDAARLWAAAGFTILLSTVVHGLTAGAAVERVAGKASEVSG